MPEPPPDRADVLALVNRLGGTAYAAALAGLRRTDLEDYLSGVWPTLPDAMWTALQAAPSRAAEGDVPGGHEGDTPAAWLARFYSLGAVPIATPEGLRVTTSTPALAHELADALLVGGRNLWQRLEGQLQPYFADGFHVRLKYKAGTTQAIEGELIKPGGYAMELRNGEVIGLDVTGIG